MSFTCGTHSESKKIVATTCLNFPVRYIGVRCQVTELSKLEKTFVRAPNVNAHIVKLRDVVRMRQRFGTIILVSGVANEYMRLSKRLSSAKSENDNGFVFKVDKNVYQYTKKTVLFNLSQLTELLFSSSMSLDITACLKALSTAFCQYRSHTSEHTAKDLERQIDVSLQIK